jgi:hypothetical protein
MEATVLSEVGKPFLEVCETLVEKFKAYKDLPKELEDAEKILAAVAKSLEYAKKNTSISKDDMETIVKPMETVNYFPCNCLGHSKS